MYSWSNYVQPFSFGLFKTLAIFLWAFSLITQAKLLLFRCLEEDSGLRKCLNLGGHCLNLVVEVYGETQKCFLYRCIFALRLLEYSHNAPFSWCLLKWDLENVKLSKKNLVKSYLLSWGEGIDILFFKYWQAFKKLGEVRKWP